MNKAAIKLVEPAPTVDSSPEPLTHFLEVADRIGRTLCREALWSGERCTWTGWATEPVGGSYRPVYRTLRSALYDGVAGVALFLAHLYAHTGDRHQRAARDGAVRQLLARLPDFEGPQYGANFTGYYPGPIGVGHALVQLAGLCEDERLAEAGLLLVEHSTAAAQPGAASLDLLSGAAGAIPALIDLAVNHGRPRLLQTAAQYGEVLLQHAVKSEEGTSWPGAGPQGRNLTGLSHGAAGIACALLELHRVNPTEHLLQAAHGALQYERTHFNPIQGNWPDFRQLPGAPGREPAYPVAWCHGAGGIGLSRLRMLELLPGGDPYRERIQEDLRAAVRTVQACLEKPPSTGLEDFSLCHGATGNAELLLQAAEVLRQPELHQAAERVGQRGIELYHRPGLPWPCGVPNAGETPSLLLGTAGIGLFYLRLYGSRQVPSVLLVLPQRAAPSPVTPSTRSPIP
ncbi:MAG: hypothetical protein JXB05_07410 [Myxococcaceae bacterium]|nr:hypothetical protein [Myxococcaceae bacterium]